LSFSKEDRDTNIFRIGFVAELLSRNKVIAITAAISPYKDTREKVRQKIANFMEVYCEAPIAVLAERDVKGLYKKALAGEVKNFTGVSDPYEPPENPEVHVLTDRGTPVEYAARIIRTAELLGYLEPGPLPQTVDDSLIKAQLQKAGRL